MASLACFLAAVAACASFDAETPAVTPASPPIGDADGAANVEGGAEAASTEDAGGLDVCAGYQICDRFDDPSRLGVDAAAPPWRSLKRSNAEASLAIVPRGQGGALRVELGEGGPGESTLEAPLDLDGSLDLDLTFEISNGRTATPSLVTVACRNAGGIIRTFVEVTEDAVTAIVGQNGAKAVATKSKFAGFGRDVQIRVQGRGKTLTLTVNDDVLNDDLDDKVEAWTGPCQLILGVERDGQGSAIEVSFDAIRVR